MIEARDWINFQGSTATRPEHERAKVIWGDPSVLPTERDDEICSLWHIDSNQKYRLAHEVQKLIFIDFGLIEANNKALAIDLAQKLEKTGFTRQDSQAAFGTYKTMCGIMSNMDNFTREYGRQGMINALHALIMYFLLKIRKLRGGLNPLNTLARHHHVFDKVHIAAACYQHRAPAFFLITNVPDQFRAHPQSTGERDFPPGSINKKGEFVAAPQLELAVEENNTPVADDEEEIVQSDGIEQTEEDQDEDGDEDEETSAIKAAKLLAKAVKYLGRSDLERVAVLFKGELVDEARARWNDNVTHLDAIMDKHQLDEADTEFLKRTFPEATVIALDRDMRYLLLARLVSCGFENDETVQKIIEWCRKYCRNTVAD